MILFTWAFHALVFHACWLASDTFGSRISRYGLLAYDQGASDSLPHPSPAPVRAVRCYLDRTAAHRPLCERLFVTAGRSKKEILKTTVSFWLWKTISRAYELSGTEQPVPAPRARETRGTAPSLLFKKNFTVDQVLKAGMWRRHTTFTRHYLRDLAHRSLDTFHLGPVVAAQTLV